MYRFDYEFKDGGCGLCSHADTLTEGEAKFLALCVEHGANPEDYLLVGILDESTNRFVWDAWNGEEIPNL